MFNFFDGDSISPHSIFNHIHWILSGLMIEVDIRLECDFLVADDTDIDILKIRTIKAGGL